LKPPDEIIQTHDGKCPQCGKKISFVPKKVEVKSADETNRRR
jgi:DNA-directed RNA polymerase subunit RPC12/RpoP